MTKKRIKSSNASVSGAQTSKQKPEIPKMLVRPQMPVVSRQEQKEIEKILTHY